MVVDRWEGEGCAPLPEDLYPDGCTAQAFRCGRLPGHDGPHRSYVSMAPVHVEWDDEFGVHPGGDVASSRESQ